MNYPDYILKSKFRFDILSVDQDSDYRKNIPEMKDIESWSEYKKRDFNSVVGYILFMYDKGSGFINKYHDVKKRREAAIEYSGIKKPEDLLNDKVFLTMINDFLLYQNDILWHTICIHEHLYIEHSMLLMSAVLEERDKDLISATKVKEEVRQNYKKIISDLEEFKKKFYQDDKEVETEINNMRFSPESISKKIK
jgi:hypothetical protein